MSDSGRLALPVVMSGEAKRQSSFFKGPLTAFASVLSGYFILAAGSLYWLVALGGALGAGIFPRTLIKRRPASVAYRLNGAYGNSHADCSGILSRLLQPPRDSPRNRLVAFSWTIGPCLPPLHRVRRHLRWASAASIATPPARTPACQCASSSTRCGLCACLGGELRLNDPVDDPPRPAEYDQLFRDRGLLQHTLLLGQFPQDGARAHEHPQHAYSHPRLERGRRIKALLKALQFYLEYILWAADLSRSRFLSRAARLRASCRG